VCILRTESSFPEALITPTILNFSQPEINSEGTTNLPKGSEVVIVDTPPYLIGTSTLFNEDGDLEFIIRVPYQVSANDIPDEDYNFLRRLAFIYVALFILGHSNGSFLVQLYQQEHALLLVSD
jgi:hypothetical protein